jgi:hypothetical protein
MALLHSHKVIDGKLCLAGEGKAFEAHHTVVGGRKPEIHAFVESETAHQTVLVVNVSTQRAHAVGRKDMILIVHTFFAFSIQHSAVSLSIIYP